MLTRRRYVFTFILIFSISFDAPSFFSASSFFFGQNILFVTVNLPDIIVSSLEYILTETSISFKAKAGS